MSNKEADLPRMYTGREMVAGAEAEMETVAEAGILKRNSLAYDTNIQPSPP